jgi:putative hydroxymethylpyrimidine transport system ATP-binding protein
MASAGEAIHLFKADGTHNAPRKTRRGMIPPPGLQITNLALRYNSETIFQNLNFTVPAGEIFALLGPSGVGNSSLLRIIAGLEPPDAGTITATDNAPINHRIAYMAQQDLLLPWATIEQNIMLGATLRGEQPNPERAKTLLDQVGLTPQSKSLPNTLSGGMRQRAALARTLYENRPIVLMDEPFSALDAITRHRIQNLATTLLTGRTTILITHDPLEACRISHTLAVLSGTPATLATPIQIQGVPPRDPANLEVLNAQAQLLKDLAA